MSIFTCKHTETPNSIHKQYNGMLIYFVYNHYYVHEQQLFNFHHYFDNKFSSSFFAQKGRASERASAWDRWSIRTNHFLVHLKQKSSNKWWLRTQSPRHLSLFHLSSCVPPTDISQFTPIPFPSNQSLHILCLKIPLTITRPLLWFHTTFHISNTVSSI